MASLGLIADQLLDDLAPLNTSKVGMPVTL